MARPSARAWTSPRGMGAFSPDVEDWANRLEELAGAAAPRSVGSLRVRGGAMKTRTLTADVEIPYLGFGTYLITDDEVSAALRVLCLCFVLSGCGPSSTSDPDAGEVLPDA